MKIKYGFVTPEVRGKIPFLRKSQEIPYWKYSTL